ncbi:Silent information regulator protein Sir2 [Thermodesulfatator indicus DSM 15286]|uniref:NAD-dependent protein deacylase n=1 Tax=Thermodesulfatator indicus (strain DSM 15286 / JCM 11887 / CIR29812) TaxID=667014 RepID=F8AAG6_THEID|nr:Sir2 family NAD+-dependent deacetylase [Thermodesulfatator indicus]AEH45386.1 Silent information regulator protein Sir2 [Thermodesulfatator indicus DSM 15286]
MGLNQISKIVILTGAGISAESGIQTFRDKGGLWEKYSLEEVATPQGFRKNPRFVHEFYNQRRRDLFKVKPNPAHYALARLEQEFPGEVLLVTQNVDDLHERAGSRNLLHMHGELLKVRCEACNVILKEEGEIFPETKCPKCGRQGTLRPHVVWFGEMPFYLDEIYKALKECDLFVAIGTSGTVYPAAGFVMIARECGAWCVELNLEPSTVADYFHEHHYGPASEVVPVWVDKILKRETN